MFIVYIFRDTTEDEIKSGSHLKLGPRTAILKGITIDLKSQLIFPAVFEWGQFQDFQTQLKDRVRLTENEEELIRLKYLVFWKS